MTFSEKMRQDVQAALERDRRERPDRVARQPVSIQLGPNKKPGLNPYSTPRKPDSRPPVKERLRAAAGERDDD